MFVTPLKTETVNINGVDYLTRHWYMDCAKELTGVERHNKFYAQFVTPAVRTRVRRAFDLETLAKAYNEGDTHLNGCTQLKQWDRLDCRDLVGMLYTNCCYEAQEGQKYSHWSPSDNVCVLKQAARLMIEEMQVSA